MAIHVSMETLYRETLLMLAHRGLLCKLVLPRSPHLPRCLAGGAPEGGTEGALVRVAEQEGDLGQVEFRLPEIFQRKLMAELVEDFGKACAGFSQVANQGALAHSQFGCHDLGLGLSLWQQIDDVSFQLDDVFRLGA